MISASVLLHQGGDFYTPLALTVTPIRYYYLKTSLQSSTELKFLKSHLLFFDYSREEWPYENEILGFFDISLLEPSVL